VDAAWITLTGSLREVRGITNDIMIRTSHVPADQINMSIESALKRLIEEPPDQVGCLPGAQPTPLDLLMQLERDHTVHRAVAELWRVCRKLSALVCVFAV
jgi:hypothetical protein